MLAIKFTFHDIKEGREFKFFQIFEPELPLNDNGHVRCEINEPDPTLNELRFKTGITEIYAVLDYGSWNNYWVNIHNNRQELVALNDKLANDPAVLKEIAEYEKDQKQFRIWQAAQKWDPN